MSRPSSVIYVGSQVGEEIDCIICNQQFRPQSSENADIRICSNCECYIQSNCDEFCLSDDCEVDDVISCESSDEEDGNVSKRAS
jgi:hypothetical protein